MVSTHSASVGVMICVGAEVCQVVGQDALAGAVQYSLSLLLEQLQSVDRFLQKRFMII